MFRVALELLVWVQRRQRITGNGLANERPTDVFVTHGANRRLLLVLPENQGHWSSVFLHRTPGFRRALHGQEELKAIFLGVNEVFALHQLFARNERSQICARGCFFIRLARGTELYG